LCIYVSSKIRSNLNFNQIISFNFITYFVGFHRSRWLSGRLTARLKGVWPGARVGQIENAFPYHLQGANGADNNFWVIKQREADGISYHAAKFGEDATNTTADMGSRTSVAFSLPDPVP
jgi:hypothetical protein